MLIKYLILPIIAILVSCTKKHDSIFQEDRFDNISSYNIFQAIEQEINMKSIDISPKHMIYIDSSIYPNKNKIILATPKAYKRKEGKLFQLETEYFYSINDSSVKVILYQWNDGNESALDFSNLSEKNISEALNQDIDSKKSRYFRIKFDELKDKVNSKLGAHTEAIIYNDKSGSFRDGIKWLNDKDTKVYLFMLGNDDNYRQINLAVYKN